MTPEQRRDALDCLMAYARATMPGDRDSATHRLMRQIDTWIAEARADERRKTAEHIAQQIGQHSCGSDCYQMAARIARDEAGGGQ